MKFAIDCHVSRGVRALLTERHHEIVVTAAKGEPDLAWFARARRAGAEVLVSGDRVFAILCGEVRPPMHWIRLRPGASSLVQRQLVDAALTGILTGNGPPPYPVPSGKTREAWLAKVQAEAEGRKRRRSEQAPSPPAQPTRAPRHTPEELERLAAADARRERAARGET